MRATDLLIVLIIALGSLQQMALNNNYNLIYKVPYGSNFSGADCKSSACLQSRDQELVSVSKSVVLKFYFVFCVLGRPIVMVWYRTYCSLGLTGIIDCTVNDALVCIIHQPLMV